MKEQTYIELNTRRLLVVGILPRSSTRVMLHIYRQIGWTEAIQIYRRLARNKHVPKRTWKDDDRKKLYRQMYKTHGASNTRMTGYAVLASESE